jgi:TATA-box binding protein (TBP) (component of TFIID and TFIIIB)
LNKAVKRNQQRFPPDFIFQLSDEEAAGLIFQSGRSKQRGGRRRSLPCAFTEECVAMLSSVLRSERAVQVNVAVMRAFVGLRRMLVKDRIFQSRFEVLLYVLGS